MRQPHNAYLDQAPLVRPQSGQPLIGPWRGVRPVQAGGLHNSIIAARLSRAQAPLAFRSSLAWRNSSAALTALSAIATASLLARLPRLGCVGFCLRPGDL